LAQYKLQSDIQISKSSHYYYYFIKTLIEFIQFLSTVLWFCTDTITYLVFVCLCTGKTEKLRTYLTLTGYPTNLKPNMWGKNNVKELWHLCENKFLDKSTRDVRYWHCYLISGIITVVKLTMSDATAFPLHFAVFLEVISGVDVGLSN